MNICVNDRALSLDKGKGTYEAVFLLVICLLL